MHPTYCILAKWGYTTYKDMSGYTTRTFAWYLDITPNGMFSLYEYPIPGKNGLSLCDEHVKQLEIKEVVLYDGEATKLAPPDRCWVCEE